MMRDRILDALNARKNFILKVAQSSLPESQYQAFRSLVLDALGRGGFEQDLDRVLHEHDNRNGTGRPTQQGKGVHHE